MNLRVASLSWVELFSVYTGRQKLFHFPLQGGPLWEQVSLSASSRNPITDTKLLNYYLSRCVLLFKPLYSLNPFTRRSTSSCQCRTLNINGVNSLQMWTSFPDLALFMKFDIWRLVFRVWFVLQPAESRHKPVPVCVIATLMLLSLSKVGLCHVYEAVVRAVHSFHSAVAVLGSHGLYLLPEDGCAVSGLIEWQTGCFNIGSIANQHWLTDRLFVC